MKVLLRYVLVLVEQLYRQDGQTRGVGMIVGIYERLESTPKVAVRMKPCRRLKATGSSAAQPPRMHLRSYASMSGTRYRA